MSYPSPLVVVYYTCSILTSLPLPSLPPSLQQSFGFITCCERNESIFFHFSQYSGKASDLGPGDEVEFEVGTDTRTGKLIARRLVRLPTGTVSFESISDGRLLGKVDCEPKIIGGGGGGGGGTEGGSGKKVSLCMFVVVVLCREVFFIVICMVHC